MKPSTSDALQLWANELSRTDLIRMYLFQFLLQGLERLLFVSFSCALGVLAIHRSW